MQDIRNFFAGVLIGISNAIPGVSGGTMAVVLNVYDKLLDAISITRWKEHKRFLLVFAMGVVLGIIGLSKVIVPLRDNYPVVLGFSFIGLVIGSLPLIYRHAMGAEKKIKSFNVILGVFAFIIIVAMSFLESAEVSNKSLEELGKLDLKLILILMVASSIAAIAMIIPGISGSLVMLLMGVYTVVIESIASFDINVLLPVALGILLGLGVGIKAIKKALHYFPQAMYFIILGLVAGSVFPIYPGWEANLEGIVGIISAIILCGVAYFSSKREL